MLSKTTRMQRGQDSQVDPAAATTGLSVDVVSPRRPVHIPRGLALGILTAIGGVLDIGDLVTNAVVGSRFGLSLAWAVVVGVVGKRFRSDVGAGGGHEPAGDSRAWSRHKAGLRCWADPPESATTRRVDRTGLGGRKARPRVVGRAQGLGIYQVIIAGAVASGRSRCKS